MAIRQQIVKDETADNCLGYLWSWFAPGKSPFLAMLATDQQSYANNNQLPPCHP